jgi:hypothetical protein
MQSLDYKLPKSLTESFLKRLSIEGLSEMCLRHSEIYKITIERKIFQTTLFNHVSSSDLPLPPPPPPERWINQ